MRSRFGSKVLVLAAVALGAVAYSSCGSVTPAGDGGTTGAAGSGGGTTGAAGTGGTTGVGGTTGTGGTSGAAGTGGRGGIGADGGVLTCRVDANDCPQGFTCACGGAGPGMCTCHRNCTDTTVCPVAEPMCGCPSTTGGARFCVNACFCSCQ